MTSVTIRHLSKEMETLYRPPFGAVATWRKIRQVLKELESKASIRTVREISDSAIACWISAYPARRPVTTRSLLSALRRACSYAVSRGWMKRNPFTFRSLAAWLGHYDAEIDTPEPKHLSMDQLSCLMTYLSQRASIDWESHRLFALAMTAALTGARALEIQAAKVRDFDLAGKILSIVPNEIRRLKTKKSRRIVVMPEQLAQILDRWLPRAESVWAFPGVTRRGPWIHGGAGGKPLDRLQAAARECGIEGVTFHAFRHSYVTQSSSRWNVPDSLVQQLCGHTKPTTTRLYRGFDVANAHRSVESIMVPILV